MFFILEIFMILMMYNFLGVFRMYFIWFYFTFIFFLMSVTVQYFRSLCNYHVWLSYNEYVKHGLFILITTILLKKKVLTTRIFFKTYTLYWCFWLVIYCTFYFQKEMQRFVKKIVDLMREEMLLSWQGGPIIMFQV